MTHFGYRLAAGVTHRLPGIGGKLAHSLAGRREAADRWIEWARTHRTNDPAVWVHAASVGEALTAMPIVQRLRTAVPSLQTMLSYSSPSMSVWPGSLETEYADYIPLEDRAGVGAALDAVRPSLIAFARGDLWSEFAAQAVARKIPLAVLGATVRPRSRRLRWPARQLLEHAYRSVSWIGAVSDDDATRCVRLGTPAKRVHVTGDPRHDQILERVVNSISLHGLAEWADGYMTLVAGSTDWMDARVVIDAFAAVRRTSDRVKLLLVPHEPSSHNVTGAIRFATERGVAAEPWPDGQLPSTSACRVVTTVGALADLYACGDIAYVGGGFCRGVHAVAEPAAFALPVIVGPRHDGSPDAVHMVERGGAVALPHRREAAAVLSRVVLHWISDRAACRTAGLTARRTMAGGASDRSVPALLDLLEGR